MIISYKKGFLVRYLITLVMLYTTLFSLESKVCQKCHPTIYNEYQNSIHSSSYYKDDKIHNAIWSRHPLYKKGKYSCAKCHANEKQSASIDCMTCHKISSIQEHKVSNKNIYTKDKKLLYSAQKGMEDKKLIYHEESSFFGLFKKSVGSPYHNIDYSNKAYYNGNICMGCHSHKQNSIGFTICKTDSNNSAKQNCISCHMPRVSGSATTIRVTKTHKYHGFAGVHNKPKMLSKYIELNYIKRDKGFDITIKNLAPHDLLTQPLRVLKLKVTLNKKPLPLVTFVKVLGNSDGTSMPWLATKEIKNSMLKANESRIISYKSMLKQGDELQVTLGYYIVNPKIAKKLAIKNNIFRELKSQYFQIK